MFNIIKMTVILTLFCIISAGSLAFVNNKTSPVIEARSHTEEDSARRNLLMGNKIDLLDFSDDNYTYEDSNGTKVSINIKKHKIKAVNIVNLKGHDEITRDTIDNFVNQVNKEQRIIATDLNDNQKFLFTIMKNALKSKIEFERYILIRIPMIHKNDTTKKWDIIKAFKIKDNDLFPLNNDQMIAYKLSAGKPVFIGVGGKIARELSNKVNIGDGYTNIKSLTNPKYSIYYVGHIGSTELGVVTTCSPKGYGGPINFLAAFDFTGKVKGVKVLSMNETPGLGAKAIEINPIMVEKKSAKFQNTNMDKNKPWFTEQFNSLSLDELYLTKDNPEGKVDAITAATITSRAITNGLREKMGEFLKLRKML